MNYRVIASLIVVNTLDSLQLHH